MVDLHGLPIWDLGYVNVRMATVVETEMTDVENKSVNLKITIIKVVFLKDSLTNISVEKSCMFHYVESDFILVLHMIMRQNVSLFFRNIYFVILFM